MSYRWIIPFWIFLSRTFNSPRAALVTETALSSCQITLIPDYRTPFKVKLQIQGWQMARTRDIAHRNEQKTNNHSENKSKRRRRRRCTRYTVNARLERYAIRKFGEQCRRTFPHPILEFLRDAFAIGPRSEASFRRGFSRHLHITVILAPGSPSPESSFLAPRRYLHTWVVDIGTC